ncbi:single-stranded DNA-binding protein [Thiocystis violacea]|uniref:single-stranded DNA-binding protein n=1 Tax=Thiocystis violacea TaxID=13725 RepID=UPI001903EF18|nr:single-stranded DNA-binding protein [Thiocystis violacea]MBK1717189.1 single-stranded DNA-binding protein [Thiocystis violacea]
MSRGLNKAILIGHLGADPEVRTLPSGDTVANLSLATSDTWTDKTSGESRERTEWHRAVLFGRLADVAAQYLHSGSRVYLEGQLRTRPYQAPDGAERTVTEIVVDVGGRLLMLDSRASGATEPSSAHQRPSRSAPTPARPALRAPTPARARPSARAPRTSAAPVDAAVPF